MIYIKCCEKTGLYILKDEVYSISITYVTKRKYLFFKEFKYVILLKTKKEEFKINLYTYNEEQQKNILSQIEKKFSCKINDSKIGFKE